MFEPTIKGHTRLASPIYSFLIENERLGRKVLFDLGVQKNWEEQAPDVVEYIKSSNWEIEIEKDVAEILGEHEMPLGAVEAIIWSHHHWDHLGDPSTFPHSTDIVVGPGFYEEFFPGGQPIVDSPIRKEYYENRHLREISAKEFNLNIAGFPAFDFFGDGSFYLIDSPGHAIGHISGLARTTSEPDTFIFMGGDIASHAGEFRPTKYVPLPSLILPNPLNLSSPTPCPGHIFEEIHPQKCGNSPFYCMGTWPDGFPTNDDPEAAIESQRKLQLLDAYMNQVFVILAHDETVEGVIDFFPKTANQWKERGWGNEVRWLFLGDFREAVTQEGVSDQ